MNTGSVSAANVFSAAASTSSPDAPRCLLVVTRCGPLAQRRQVLAPGEPPAFVPCRDIDALAWLVVPTTLFAPGASRSSPTQYHALQREGSVIADRNVCAAASASASLSAVAGVASPPGGARVRIVACARALERAMLLVPGAVYWCSAAVTEALLVPVIVLPPSTRRTWQQQQPGLAYDGAARQPSNSFAAVFRNAVGQPLPTCGAEPSDSPAAAAEQRNEDTRLAPDSTGETPSSMLPRRAIAEHVLLVSALHEDAFESVRLVACCARQPQGSSTVSRVACPACDDRDSGGCDFADAWPDAGVHLSDGHQCLHPELGKGQQWHFFPAAMGALPACALSDEARFAADELAAADERRSLCSLSPVLRTPLHRCEKCVALLICGLSKKGLHVTARSPLSRRSSLAADQPFAIAVRSEPVSLLKLPFAALPPHAFLVVAPSLLRAVATAVTIALPLAADFARDHPAASATCPAIVSAPVTLPPAPPPCFADTAVRGAGGRDGSTPPGNLRDGGRGGRAADGGFCVDKTGHPAVYTVSSLLSVAGALMAPPTAGRVHVGGASQPVAGVPSGKPVPAVALSFVDVEGIVEARVTLTRSASSAPIGR